MQIRIGIKYFRSMRIQMLIRIYSRSRLCITKSWRWQNHPNENKILVKIARQNLFSISTASLFLDKPEECKSSDYQNKKIFTFCFVGSGSGYLCESGSRYRATTVLWVHADLDPDQKNWFKKMFLLFMEMKFFSISCHNSSVKNHMANNLLY